MNGISTGKRLRLFCYGLLLTVLLSILALHYMQVDVKRALLVPTILKIYKSKIPENGTSTTSNERISFHRSALSKMSFDAKKNTPVNKSEIFEKWVSGPTKVLIISSGRSGSSFLGDLFFKNPKVMYLFEPLATFLRDPKPDIKSFKLLEQIYGCKSVDYSYLDFLRTKKSFQLKSSHIGAFSLLCQRGPHDRACLARLIKRSCERASNIVTKILTHRLPSGGTWGIKKLMEMEKNLKIIHLVRDPRRVIYSMKVVSWFKKGNFSSQVRKVCNTVWKNMEYTRNNTFFKGRYKLVVFQDMIKHPFTTVVNLYDFLNLGLVPKEVFAWIAENTKGSLRKKGISWDAYSTYRNSSEVLNKKVELTEQESNAVNKYCKNIIGFLEK